MIRAKLIQDKQILFGLDWNQSTKETLSSDLKLESDRRALNFGVSRTYETLDGRTLCQFALSDIDDAAGSYSAADILSTLQENLVFIYKINTTDCWVCVIHDGEIVSGGDRVIPLENFSENFEKTLSDMDIDMSQFKVYADSEVVSFCEGIYDVEISFLEVVEKNDFKSTPSFKKTRVSLQRHILMGLGLAIVVGAGALFFTSGSDEVKMVAQPKQNIEDMRLKLPKSEGRSIGDLVNQKVGPTKSQIMEDAYQEELSWINFDFNLNNNEMVIAESLEFIREQNIHEGGWEARNYYYDISAPDYHEVVWSKKSYGTALTLKNALEAKDIDQMLFNEKGTRVSSFVKIDKVSSNKAKNVLDVMKNTDKDLFNFMHDLDVGNFTWLSELTAVSERPVPIEGINNMVQAKKRQLNIQTRDFRISGSGLTEMQKFSSIIGGHERFVVERLSFDFNQNFNWIIYGVFYEKEIR